MMNLTAALARTFAMSLLFAIAGAAAAQQDYPSKPIRFILPYAPGGSTSTVARLIGQKLTENWGQQVIVDNRGGGNTLIGTEALVKSPADGYTILLVTSTFVLNPSLVQTPYDAVKDFAPVAMLVGAEFMLVRHPSLQVGTLQEFIALAKSRPGELNYASSGSGTANHLAAELFCIMAGVKMQHIPYKGGGPALTDLLGGQVQLHINVAIGLIPHIKSGKLRGIAISGPARLAELPDVPTFAEAGLPGFEATNWMGIVAPAGTPKAIIDKLSAEFGRILALPDVKERLVSQGMDPMFSGPAQFSATIRSEIPKWAKVIKAANIKLDN